jgi:hypothetical protein
MSEPTDHHQQSYPPTGETRLVTVNGKVYAVHIVPAEPTHTLSPSLPTPAGQQLSATQTPIHQTFFAAVPTSQRQTIITHPSQQFLEQTKLILWLLAGIGAIALLVAGIARLLAPAAPMPITPAAPQTIIVQPPAPEQHRYRREQCEPAGLFGWGKTCRQEEGWE